MSKYDHFWIKPSGNASKIKAFGGYHKSAVGLICEHLQKNGYSLRKATNCLIETSNPKITGLYKVEKRKCYPELEGADLGASSNFTVNVIQD